MSAPAAAERRRPGRPASDAPQRIVAAALEVLKRDGYAGLTTAKVAAASGQNKALIPYYFGSKQGLLAAVAREVGEMIIAEVVEGLADPRTVAELTEGLAAGVWRILDRDERLQRAYFDLASQSVVEEPVRLIMTEMKEGFRAVLREYLRSLEDGPARSADIDAAAVLLIAGIEGLALERLDRGEGPVLRRARSLFVRGAVAAISTS